jgi:hypothetical protein
MSEVEFDRIVDAVRKEIALATGVEFVDRMAGLRRGSGEARPLTNPRPVATLPWPGFAA